MTVRARAKAALGELTAGRQLDPEMALRIFSGEMPGYENLECYIYRLKPKPPDRPRETPSYLAKLMTPFTLDDIKKRFGGGVFRCMANSLTEKDPVSNHRLTKANFLFEIDGPPIFSGDVREAPAAPAPPVVVVPGQPADRPRDRPFTIGGLQLTELKILKELFAPNPANQPNPGATMLDVFLKGVEFAKGLGGSVETNELDVVKEILKVLQGSAAALPAGNGFMASPEPGPARPGGRVISAPPAQPEAQVQVTLDSLLNFLMDSYEGEKSAEDTAGGLLVMVPAAYLKQMLAYPDAQVVATLKSWMAGYEFFEEAASEKEMWLTAVVAAARQKSA